jgi:hypothetical protein
MLGTSPVMLLRRQIMICRPFVLFIDHLTTLRKPLAFSNFRSECRAHFNHAPFVES